MKILVTGACGVTSRSVTRGLRRDCNLSLEIIGAGIFENQYSLHEGIYDKTVVLPKCKNPDYSSRMRQLLKEEKIDAALVVPELEVEVWAKEKFDVPYLIPQSKFITNVSNKKRLNSLLSETKNVPKSIFLDRNNLDEKIKNWEFYPCWIRPTYFGVTSGRGAAKCNNKNQVKDHIKKSSYTSEWQISEFIQGRNIAVSLLYKNSKLVQHAMYERLEYFEAHLFESGVSGNISKGQIFDDTKLLAQTVDTVELLSNKLEIKIEGFITIDLLLSKNYVAKITEVNSRPTAPVEAYSLANIPIVGKWLEQTLSTDLVKTTSKMKIPSYIYRDIDGGLIVKET